MRKNVFFLMCVSSFIAVIATALFSPAYAADISVIEYPLPTYPALPRARRIGGTVDLEGVIGADGSVTSVKILGETGRFFSRSYASTLLKWRFKGANVAGATVTVRFVFDEKEQVVRVADVLADGRAVGGMQSDAITQKPNPISPAKVELVSMTPVVVSNPSWAGWAGAHWEVLADLGTDLELRNLEVLRLDDQTPTSDAQARADAAVLAAMRSMRFEGKVPQELKIKALFAVMSDPGPKLVNLSPAPPLRSTDRTVIIYRSNSRIDIEAYKKANTPQPPPPAYAQKTDYSVADLPAALVGYQPMREESDPAARQAFLQRYSDTPFSSACLDFAYPYMRSYSYQNRVEGELQIANGFIQGSAGSDSELLLDSGNLESRCASSEYRESAQKALDPRTMQGLDRVLSILCPLAGDAGRDAFVLKDMSSLTGFTNVCVDWRTMANDKFIECKRSLRGKTPGLSGDEICRCSADAFVDFLVDSKKWIGSRGLVNASTRARLQCAPR